MDVRMWNSQITRAELSNSINQLQKIRRVLESPKENVSHPQVELTHRLSLSREQEIASNLAFIAATSKNHLRVMAVCVEEHSSGERVTIRLASNTGGLSELTTEFEVIAAIMMNAARRSKSHIDHVSHRLCIV